MRSALRRLGREVTRDWTSALRELVLVIVGVLIALAGQSWWEGRSERQRETAYLRQLLVDIRETEIHLGHAIAGDSASLDKVTRFLGAADTLLRFGSALPTDSLSPLAETAYSSFVPLSGTYTALVQSDNLRLLRSDSLRSLQEPTTRLRRLLEAELRVGRAAPVHRH